MGDRIALLKEGGLVQAGTAQELYLNPVSLFAAGFFSELNLFDARVKNGAAETPLGRFAAKPFADGTAVTVAVRLAGIRIVPGGRGVAARIVWRRFLGETELADIAIAGVETPVRARLRRGELPEQSGDIGITVRKSDVLVFERRAESA